MITGREVSQPMAVSPIVFTDCNMVEIPHAPRFAAAAGGGTGGAAPAPGRREVKVGGKRIRTIDVHAHCVIPETLDLLGASREQRGPGIDEVGDRRIREMD